jgi:hypothetical protein
LRLCAFACAFDFLFWLRLVRAGKKLRLYAKLCVSFGVVNSVRIAVFLSFQSG